MTTTTASKTDLLSAAAAVDVIGLGRWKLPDTVVASLLAERPRLGFREEFRSLWAAEAAAVPHGRARLLRRWGAFDLAIRLAPYRHEDRAVRRANHGCAGEASGTSDETSPS